MKILFAGTPDFVFPVLKFLASEHKLVGILTKAPTPSGRGKKLKPAPILKSIKQFLTQTEKTPSKNNCAEINALKALSKAQIIQAENLDKNVIEQVQKLNCDLLVCYSFGNFFTEEFLSIFKYGGINIHPSLLPKWRGASPVPSAILNGDKITGVTVQTLAKKMDSGKILAVDKYPLNDTKTTGEVLEILTEKSIPLLQNILANFEKALAKAKDQDENKATYCEKIERKEIDWNKSAVEIAREVLALSPNPKAFSWVAGERITLTKVAPLVNALNTNSAAAEQKNFVEKKYKIGKILKAKKGLGILVQTGKGILVIKRLQRAGKKELDWQDFLNGYNNFLDLEFTQSNKK